MRMAITKQLSVMQALVSAGALTDMEMKWQDPEKLAQWNVVIFFYVH